MPTNLDQRYQEAFTDPNLQKPFNTSDWQNRPWKNHEKLSERTAQDDLQILRSQKRVEGPVGGPYNFGPLSEQEVITRSRQAVTAKGRTSSQIGTKADANRIFTTADVKALLISVKTVPESGLTESAMAGLMRVLSTSEEFKQTSPGADSYTWAPMPRQRLLPDSWQGDKVRDLYYINGSGFTSMRTTVRKRDMDSIQAAIDAFEANKMQEHQRLWNRLREQKIVLDGKYDPGKRGEYLDLSKYDVDHLLPLAMHWCVGGGETGTTPGNNTTQGERNAVAGNESNLRMVPLSENRSKSAEGYGYKQKWWVGPDFKGPDPTLLPQYAYQNTMFQNFV